MTVAEFTGDINDVTGGSVKAPARVQAASLDPPFPGV